MDLLKKIISTILVISLILVQFGHAEEKELTIYVDAGARECFFQPVTTGDIIDIEYQVIDGGHGDLDVNFDIAEFPSQKIVVRDHKKSDNIHRIDVNDQREYRFCFDNTFSTFNRKTVFFTLIVEKEGVTVPYDENQGLTGREIYDMKIQDIMDAIGRVKVHLTRARQLQDMIRSTEARDRNIAEENNFKVSSWSIFQICLMLFVGSIQVVMVRSLFDTNSKVQSVLQKILKK